ncbi:methylcobamide:CoM methyltransferase MtbA [Clostridium tagluense]|uniref:Methylcobamide--CoM methyltransferase n=1 Tax=Clostridium tagluense TaxID=360422 RepID=A0A401UNB2_9CLOT|nr:methylcobamide:CoM methyltransferase MtbA [Clostridium tagluense]MCB2298221.1 MtaA/CmuA family methyltransferase [Clostridium tagluense]GCD11019.1 methylcobamide--CoM methyltransferase [Clostridium tagluense]
MITPKERLFKVLKGEKVDRPPCICPGGMMNMITEEVMDITGVNWPEAHSDAGMMAGLSFGVYENGGFENFGVPFCMTIEAEAMGATVYMGTKINEPRVTNYPINYASEWDKLNNIDVSMGRAKVALEAIKILKIKNPLVPIVANLTGPVSLASSLMEPMVYYKELRRNPIEAHKFMKFVTENLITFGKAQIEAGADVLTISDPSGTGEILGPKMFREFALPYLNTIIDALKHECAGGTIIHICGRLKSIYSELKELHSNAISFDAITNVTQMVEFVDNKVIMGNVSTFALENSSQENIKSIAQNCMHSGCDILSPACGIGTKTSMDNIRSMVDAAKGYSEII